jgi:hypothetical protein
MILHESIQEQRRSEKGAAVLAATPRIVKQLAELREQAANITSQADAAEAEALQGYNAIETLFGQRANALIDLSTLRGLAVEVEHADASVNGAIEQLVVAARTADPTQKQSANLSLDAVIKLKVISPFIGPMLEEKVAAVADLGKQILAIASKNKFDLKTMLAQCQDGATGENSARYTLLTRGFAGLISAPGE